MPECTSGPARDNPEMLEAAQNRIKAAIDAADGVSYAICARCNGQIMYVYSVFGGWLWISVDGQTGTPPAQCPDAPGYYGIGHGPHRPAALTAGDPLA